MTPQTIKRRSVLKGILGTLSLPSTAFVKSAAAEKTSLDEWIGYSICDNCNQVPSCGIKFKACGNIIQSIGNWSENPRHVLCSKGLSTLQRLYNPNRLLYPMKRTNPKGSDIRDLCAAAGMKLIVLLSKISPELKLKTELIL